MKHARPDYDRIQDPAGLIPADEPVFLIRGQDVNAPTVVRSWARLAKLSGAGENIVRAAYRQADAMEKWHNDVGTKVPDMPHADPT